MRYEIIKDKEDLLVLVINNVVVAISRDMSQIFTEIQKDYANRETHPRRVYNPAVITDKKTQKETERKQTRIFGQLG